MTSDGRAERDDAMARVDAHANQIWKDTALRAVAHLARYQDEMTTDDVWESLETHYPHLGTHEPRALGPVMRRAATLGIIERTDRTRDSDRAVCHRNPKRIWASVKFQ